MMVSSSCDTFLLLLWFQWLCGGRHSAALPLVTSMANFPPTRRCRRRPPPNFLMDVDGRRTEEGEEKQFRSNCASLPPQVCCQPESRQGLGCSWDKLDPYTLISIALVSYSYIPDIKFLVIYLLGPCLIP